MQKIPAFYAEIPAFYAVWDSIRGNARGAQGGEPGGGSPMWPEGVCSLVRGVTRACSLTC